MKWLDKNQEKILFFTWCFIILTCLLVIFTCPVKAATSGNDNSLPFIVNNNLPEDFSFYQENFEYLANAWGINPSLISRLDWSSDKVLAYTVLNDGGLAQTIVIVPYFENSSYSITLSDSYSAFDITSDFITVSFSSYDSLLFTTSNGTTNFYGYNFQGSGSVNFFGSFRYPVFISGNFVDFQDNIVLALPSEPVPDVHGHATPPINDTGHYIPNVNPQKPTIIPFHPSVPQFPTIDTSTLEKLVESLIDIVKYGFSYIGGLLNDLVSNIVNNFDNWVDYIVQAFSKGFNNVVGTLHDLATDFYNNMVSLFEPLYQFFNGVATFFNNLIQLGIDGDSFSFSTFLSVLLVPDSEEFAQTLLNGDIHHVVPLVQAVKTKFLSLFDSFYNLTPTKVFLIPSFTWHGQTFNLSIDFSWYDDYKVYGDTIITGFLIISYIYWFVLQLNSMFRGGNSIGHDVMKAGAKE